MAAYGVRQRSTTDCLTACIASVTGIQYEQCPQLSELTGEIWVLALRDWCREQGIGFVYWHLADREDDWPILDGTDVVAVGKTNRSADYHHAVVMSTKYAGGKTSLIEKFDPIGLDFIQSIEYIILLVVKQDICGSA